MSEQRAVIEPLYIHVNASIVIQTLLHIRMDLSLYQMDTQRNLSLLRVDVCSTKK